MKTLKFLVISVALLLVSFSSFARPDDGHIKGKVFDKLNNKPVEFVAVILSSLPDSTMKSSLVTDSTGVYSFNAPAGEYFISIQMVGYKPVKTSKITLLSKQQKELPPIKLENYEIKGVMVTTKPPLIEQKADRLVMNVDGSINTAGESAYDLLKKAPGVYLDKDDNVILRGKEGVMVTINDRPTHLSAKDLANYLKGMQSSEIGKVEIITNPPSRYDASGNSGIINIVTKKNLKPGINGSVYAGIKESERFGANAGANFNARYGKVNVYGSYNPGTYTGKWHNDMTRYMSDGRFVQDINGGWRFNDGFGSFKIGADYDINDKNMIGFMVRRSANTEKDNLSSNTSIYDTSNVLDSVLFAKNKTNYTYDNTSYNVNYKSKLDTLGKELSFDLDYAKFNNNSTIYNDNYYYNTDGSEKRLPFFLKGRTPSDITVQSAKVDYVNPFLKYFRLETGAKYSKAETNNDLDYQYLRSNSWIDDLSRSNEFDYTEEVLAGYVSFSYEKNNTSIKAGVRTENTNSKGNSITMNKVVKRSYLDWFPTFFAQQKLSKNHTLGFSYNRRIDRPNYQDLNPFVFYVDQYTYQSGNPFLTPQYTNSFSLTHSYKNSLITTFSYSRTTDVMTDVLLLDDKTKIAEQTKQNYNNLNDISLNVNYNYSPVSWFRTNNNLTAFQKRYERNVGSQTHKQTSLTLNSVNSFTLPADYSIEVSGFYESKMLYGVFEVQPQYFVDLGVQKNFMNKKATVKLSVRDIFKTLDSKVRAKYDNVDLINHNTWSSQAIALNFSYRFGSDKVKPSRQHSTGIDDEQGRVGKGR